MMVYFISECEKSALPKTRRILDAFANRIGRRTWQTAITQAGLDTVQQLLKETASKSTAVSCHWVRSKARTQFLWSIGRKGTFTETGKVSVNLTSIQEVVIEGMSMSIETIIANTKRQKLTEHLFGVAYLARDFVKHFYPEHKPLHIAAFYAGLLHDLGKVDTPFQSWLQKESPETKTHADIPSEGVHISQSRGEYSWEKYPRHNEVSFFLTKALSALSDCPASRLKHHIEHAIYWHHEKPLRKEDFINFGSLHKALLRPHKSSGLKELLENAAGLLNEISPYLQHYEIEKDFASLTNLTALDTDSLLDLKKYPLPDFKDYDQCDDFEDFSKSIQQNVYASILRACLVSADRKISSLSSAQLSLLIKEKRLSTLLADTLPRQSDLVQKIQKMKNGFDARFPNSERNAQQAITAKDLSYCTDVAVLNGPAGCGKTKISLEAAALIGANKILWICPRVQICQGLYHDLSSSDYLPNTTIEIYTGDFKKHCKASQETNISEAEKFTGDIIITTIDQVLNGLTTHRDVSTLIDYLDAFIIFDEFHEYISMAGFNLLFAELIKLKQLRETGTLSALLVSATPNYTFIEDFLKVDADDIISICSFNQSPYHLKFIPYDEEDMSDENPLFAPQPENSFVISNTAYLAQRSYLANQNREDALLFHGKYIAQDKQDLFKKLYQSFGRMGTQQNDLLRAGPIVQASLNISCDHMVTQFTHAENWLQRLGRLDRFGCNSGENIYITAIPQTVADGKFNGKCARFLSELKTLKSAYAWYEFLNSNTTETSLQLADLYDLYQKFHHSEQGKQAVTQDLIDALRKGAIHLNNKIQDPVTLPKKKLKQEKQLKKNSLRDDSRYVQMATCHLTESGLNITNDYLCDNLDRSYTLSLSEITGRDPNGDRNLLSFMHQKHHKIQSAKEKKSLKKAHHSAKLKNEAVYPETPIFVSYTPADLNLCNDTPHAHAIYYVLSKKQPVGAMSRDQLPE